MNTKHHLTVLFFCGFALQTVSAQICETNLLEGQSCIIKLEKKSGETIYELEWIFTHFIDTKTYKAQWRNGKIINNIPDATIQSDGSLRLQNVKLNNTGKYRYEIYDSQGKKFAGIEKEITVYAKATKPNVKLTCDGETATITCDIQIKDKRDLTWVQDMKGENKVNLTLTSKQIEENAEYSCRVQNPVSNEQSDVKTISFSAEICETNLLEGNSCILNLEKKNGERISKIEWIFISSIDTKTYKAQQKGGKTINNIPDATIQFDGSLKLQNVKLNNTGKYRYEIYDGEGKKTTSIEKEITVYVSAQICETNLLEGNSCIIKLEKKSGERISKIEWIFTSSIDTKTYKAQWRNGRTVNNIPDATIQSGGSLKLQNVKLNNTGKYRYEIYDGQGKKTTSIEKEITVYAKVTKPNVKLTCDGETATLTCDIQMKDKRYLIITWIQGKQDMKGENKQNLTLTSKQIEENAEYSCRVQNPVSNEQSDVKTVSC